MIFSKRCTILFISKEKIRWAPGQVPSGKILGEVKEVAWSEENLHVALKDIASNLSKRVRIVIGEEFAYAAYLKKDEQGSDIRSAAQSRIPEKITDGWDTQMKADGDIQAMAIQEGLFASLKKLFREMRLKAEVIETESVALSRMLPAKKGEAVIFAKQDGKFLLGAARDSAVLATEVFSSPPSTEDFRKFTEYVSGRYGVAIGQMFVTNSENCDREVFRSLGLIISETPLDPMEGICKKKDIRGRDADVLNIALGS